MSLQITPSGAANLAASQIVNQANGFFAQLSGALQNGIPARGTNPAVAAGDLANALGVANLTALQASLSGFSS